MKLGSRHSALGRSSSALGRYVSPVVVTPTGPFHGSAARIDFTLAGSTEDASIILRSVKATRTKLTENVSDFAATDSEFVTGPEENGFEFEGYFDADLDLAGTIDTFTAFDYYPAGRTAGLPKLTGSGTILADLDTQNPVNGITTIAGKLTVDGELERGTAA